ncbi:uncharacterized protein EDB91DRAFT_1086727 [Suillus paluster]|uniref:uncharacterized protein n=1 Tax=Suillus paluster TaxID=48578 RepID=UPI001B877660|nr:uncharacterized protein EDB91DRAFT_1086727 [Suillus paluster]KAG1726644.1 hypothetical protein EDB91DRAFT_1086727 [Suillus paluster]
MGPPVSIRNNNTPGPSVIVEDISTFGPWSTGPYHTGILCTQEHLEEARQQAEEDDAQRQQGLRDEEEAAHIEDRKKNKNKYVPLKRIKIQPTLPSSRPSMPSEGSKPAITGLDDATASALVAEPDALVMLPAADGIHSWVPAAAVKDPKAPPVTKDEHLTWEEFNEAAPRIIVFMKMHDWPDDRVNMHIQFWTTIQGHRWRHSLDLLQQKALLLYQSQQRRCWHLTIGTMQGWSLEENQPRPVVRSEGVFIQ